MSNTFWLHFHYKAVEVSIAANVFMEVSEEYLTVASIIVLRPQPHKWMTQFSVRKRELYGRTHSAAPKVDNTWQWALEKARDDFTSN
jgi:hypothetical protein